MLTSSTAVVVLLGVVEALLTACMGSHRELAQRYTHIMTSGIRSIGMLALVLACEAKTRGRSVLEPEVPQPTEAPPAEARPAEARPADPPAEDPTLPAATVPSRPWHLAARLEVAADDDAARLRLFRSDDGELFVTSGPLVMQVGPDGSFTADRSWLRGIEPPGGDAPTFEGIASFDVETLGGRLPDALYLSLRYEIDGRSDAPSQRVYRRAGSRWVPVDHVTQRTTWLLQGLATWRDDSVLALRSFIPTPSEHIEFSDEYYAGFLEHVARQRRLVVLRGRPKAPAALAKERIIAFDARETGEIAAITLVTPKGMSASEAELAIKTTYATLHYAPGRPLQRVPIPGLTDAIASWSEPAVAFGADGTLRAWGNVEITNEQTMDVTEATLLLRFDGERWIPESPPPCQGRDSLVAFAIDGERQWAGCHSRPPWDPTTEESGLVLSRVAEGPWQREVLPKSVLKGGHGIDIIVRGPDDVWVAGRALARTQPVDTVVVLPGLAAQWSPPGAP
jgi:hypothetical protein